MIKQWIGNMYQKISILTEKTLIKHGAWGFETTPNEACEFAIRLLGSNQGIQQGSCLRHQAWVLSTPKARCCLKKR